MSKYKIGLALSGGGIRGVAHLGVLKAMEEFGIAPQIISGVSAGAIIGAMYSDGRSVEEMLGFFENSSFKRGVKLNMPKNGGFVNVNGYRSYLEKFMKARDFSELRIPLIVNATDLEEGTIAYFDSGNIIDAVVASASVPVLFNPAKIGKRFYVDGGILCNLPAEILRKDCDFVLGVHVNPIWPLPPSTKYGMKAVAERVFHLAVNGNTYNSKMYCDLVIDLKRDREVGMFESSMSEYLMRIGYEAAVAAFETFDFRKYGIQVNKI